MKVIIIEDEEIAAEKLVAQIHNYDPAIEIITTLDSVKNSIKYFSSFPLPDLLFLDVHLGDGLSFQIFEKIKLESPIIFTTAFDEFAIRAFKHKSIDYLLKPIKQEELNSAIEQYKSWSSRPIHDLSDIYELMQKKDIEYKSRFSITIGHKIRTINIDEVSFFYAEGNIVFLVTKGDRQYPVDYSLESLSKLLQPKNFFRINRQYIVNLSSIEQVHIYPKSKLKLTLTPSVKEGVFVSVDKVVKFKNWLDG